MIFVFVREVSRSRVGQPTQRADAKTKQLTLEELDRTYHRDTQR